MKIFAYFCNVFNNEHKNILLNLSTELEPRKEKKEHANVHWSYATERRLHHSTLEAVTSLVESMEGLRFLFARLLVLPCKQRDRSF